MCGGVSCGGVGFIYADHRRSHCTVCVIERNVMAELLTL